MALNGTHVSDENPGQSSYSWGPAGGKKWIVEYCQISIPAIEYREAPEPDVVEVLIVTLPNGMSGNANHRVYLKQGSSLDWSLIEGRPLSRCGLPVTDAISFTASVPGSDRTVALSVRMDYREEDI